MRTMKMLLVAASLSMVAACGGQGDDATGDIVAKDADVAADTIEQQADAMSGAAGDVVEGQAEAVREAGENAEEAIDDADVETSNPAASAAKIEAETGMPTSAETARDAANPNQ